MPKIASFSLPNTGSHNRVGNVDGLLVEMYRRIDAYFTFYNVPVVTGYGYKSIEEQTMLYLKWMKYKAWLDGGRVGPEPPSANLAAFPGTSKHNIGAAYDANRIGLNTDGSPHYPATMDADFLLPPNQQAMREWGLNIPMWKGATKQEKWHIELIELAGVSNPQQFLLEDDLYKTSSGYRKIYEVNPPNWPYANVYMEGADVKRVQRALKIPETGIFESLTTTKVKELQITNALVVDGVVGTKTWPVINNIILTMTPPPIDYKALYNDLVPKFTDINKKYVALAEAYEAGEIKYQELAGKYDELVGHFEEEQSKLITAQKLLDRLSSFADLLDTVSQK